MTTTTVKTIGTGGDYTTLQAWEDASPANLVTSDVVWQGQCFNQEFFSSSAGLLNVSGSTTDATRYKELTTYAGASFVDNASVQTNALRYNASNGAGIRNTYAWTSAVVINENYFRISKLQVSASTAVALNGVATTGLVMDKCIVENSGVSNEALKTYGSCTVKNSLIVGRSTSSLANMDNGTAVYNCTFARTGTGTASIFTGSYSTTTLKNCAFFGAAATLASGSSTRTYTTCYTDTASPPSGCTTVAYDTSTGSGFQNITDATRDFRIKSGSALVDVGTTDSTNAANDIAGTSRPQGSSYDVGAWELAASGAYSVAKTEAMTLGDSASSQAALGASISETITLSHSQDAVIGRFSTITEAMALIDSPSGVVSIGGNVTEAMALADTSSQTFGATGVATEAMSLAATHSTTFAATSVITEAMALTDTASQVFGATSVATDAMSLADISSQAFSATSTISEAMALAATHSTGFGATSTANEAMTLADTVNGAPSGGSFGASITESVTLADAASNVAALTVTVTEAITLSETQSLSGMYAAAITEPMALADTQSQHAALSAALVEAMSLGSGAAASWGVYVSLVAALTLDTAASQSLNDLFTASDFWAYQIQPQNLRYSVAPQSLAYSVPTQKLQYSIAPNKLAYSIV